MTNATAIRAPARAISTKAVVVVVVAALMALAIALGGRVIAQQIVSGLMLGAIYLTVAVAFTLTIGVLNFLNFTIPSLFMLTGMVAWGLREKGMLGFAGGWAWLVALIAGIVVATTGRSTRVRSFHRSVSCLSSSISSS